MKVEYENYLGEGSERCTYFTILGDNINVKVEEEMKTSQLMNIYGCPQ